MTATSPAVVLPLIAAAQAGDERAFEDLMRRYESQVKAWLATRMVDQPGAQEDVAALVWLEVWRYLHRWKPIGSPFGAWLYVVMLHQVSAHYKTLRRRRETSVPDVFPFDVRTVPGADVAALARVDLASYRPAVATLHPRLRLVVAWHVLAELSLSEVAGKLGRPVGTVKRQYWEARHLMREALGGVA